MKTGWTPERKKKQAQTIRLHKPWKKSTGPRTPEGKARSSRNAWKGGMRQQLQQELQEIRKLLQNMR